MKMNIAVKQSLISLVSDSDEEFHGYVSDGWEIVTSSSSSESPSGSDSGDENVDIAASSMSPTSSP